jgi:hypothetical protein
MSWILHDQNCRDPSRTFCIIQVLNSNRILNSCNLIHINFNLVRIRYKYEDNRGFPSGGILFVKFAAYMAFSFNTFFHVVWVPFFLSLHIRLHVLYTSVNYVFLLLFYVFLFLCLCILIVMYVLYILFSLCCSTYCLCVNVYCTTATGCQPNCS